MADSKVKRYQRQTVTDTVMCLLKNLPVVRTPEEIIRQELFQRLLASGYSKNNLLLDSTFLGYDGQVFSADVIALEQETVLHVAPLLVISIKKPSQQFNYDWLQKFQFSGAKYIAWFNGKEFKIFAYTSEEYKEIPPFLPNYDELLAPSNNESFRSKSSLHPGYNLKQILSNLHDHLYGNSNIRIPSRLGIEIQKILLIKKFDEEQSRLTCKFCIAQHELPTGLNGDKKILPESFHSVGSRVRDLAANHDCLNIEQKIGIIELDDPSIYYAVFHLEGISLSRTPSDVLGDALETFRSVTIKREGGQFFTHRYVIDLALHIVGFKGDEEQTLADISCGTSGFLHRAKNIIIDSAKQRGVLSEKEQTELVSNLLLGVEIDHDLVQISNTSPEFSKLPKSIVEEHDSLSPFSQWSDSLFDRLAPNSRAFSVGNPPFGTKITIKNLQVLKEFSLAHAWTKKEGRWLESSKIVPRSPDVLFIERNLSLLIPGKGRMALVVPYQILSGPKEGFVREWIMANCRVLAIIDLPEETFQPYTGTKGALLVVERRLQPNPQWETELPYPIFMACPQKIGHDRRGKPIFKHNNPAEVDTDLPEIADAFDAHLNDRNPTEVSQNAFLIFSTVIKRETDIRLNAAYYRPSSSDLRSQIASIVESNTSLTVTSLGNLVDDIFYPGRFKRDYTEVLEDSVPFLGGSNITELIPITKKRILKESSYYQTLALKKGWILITRSGTTGIVSTVPSDWEGFAASEHLIRIIPNPQKLHPGYLCAYLRSEIGQNLLRDGIFGSVVDEINCNYIASIPVLHPKNLEEANKIGEQIARADVLRAEASKLIADASSAIEDFIR